MTTILDVIHDLTNGHNNFDFNKLSEPDIAHFGEQVRTFSQKYSLPKTNPVEHPSYLGGWPSANVCDGRVSQLAMTNLLYSGQLLAKDPISNWFSEEQYQIRKANQSPNSDFVRLTYRPGYRKYDGSLNIPETRYYLARIIPALQSLAPLIESEQIILVPSYQFEFRQREQILELQQLLSNVISQDPREFANRFEPPDLPVNDSTRGMFMFAGGNRAGQIRNAIYESLYYFSSEYCLANLNGYDYVAPFPYEQHICETGLTNSLFASPGHKVIRALLESSLPLYSELTPEIVASLKDDENYAGFRAQLYNVYRDIPLAGNRKEIRDYIAEAEEHQLKPILQEVQNSVERGSLAKRGLRFSGEVIKIGTGILLNYLINPSSLVTAPIQSTLKGGTTKLVDRLIGGRKKEGPITVWKKLYGHNRTVRTELENIQRAGQQEERKGPYWSIATEPSMKVTISSGFLILDYQSPSEKNSLNAV